ncbi:MAG: LytR C-terminal domain-containing protein [Burkholderiales bacterium]
MPNLKAIVLAICSAWALGSCASLKGPEAHPLRVEPVAGFAQNNTHHPQALYQLGRFYQGQLRNKEAKDAYQRALAKNPKLADAHNALGVIYASEGKYDLAVKEFNAAIALAPDSAHFHNNLGYVYLLSSKEEEAVVALSEAQRLDPENPRARANMTVARERINAENPNLAGVEIRPIQYSEPVVEQQIKRETEAEGLKLVETESNIYELRQTVPHQVAIVAQPVKESLLVPLKKAKVEVSNGNGVTRMARKVATYLGINGVPTSRITNHKSFDQLTTQIEYREGFKLQAKSLNSKLPKPANLVASEKLREGIDLRLVLGRDLGGDVALFDGEQKVASQR